MVCLVFFFFIWHLAKLWEDTVTVRVTIQTIHPDLFKNKFQAMQLQYHASFYNGPITRPPVLLLAAFSRTAHPNNFTLNTALPWVLSNTPATCEVDRMNGCPDNRRTDRQTETPSILARLWMKFGSFGEAEESSWMLQYVSCWSEWMLDKMLSRLPLNIEYKTGPSVHRRLVWCP